jgi:hypothetical protein
MKRRNVLRGLTLVAGGAAAGGAIKPTHSAESPRRSFSPSVKLEVGAQRLPKAASRDTIPAEELEAFEKAVARIPKMPPGFENDVHQYREAHYWWTALSHKPLISLAYQTVLASSASNEGKPGAVTIHDHELVIMTLALDSGYYAYVVTHTATSLKKGMRIEAIEALRDHRDDLLTEKEYQLVEFIRATRDMTMTDDIWNKLKTRIGSERGILEYVFTILNLDSLMRLGRAIGAPGMPRTAFDQMLSEYKSGARKI